MTRLQRLLHGADRRSASRLAELWRALGPRDPAICWYPSAGNCFRDVLAWAQYPQLRDDPPDLHVHTDYWPDALPAGPLLYQDDRTKVTLDDAVDLKVACDIRYEVHPDRVAFPQNALWYPRVRLLDVTVSSATLGTLRRVVLYFHFENINWFEEFALRRGIRLSHVFKVREGVGFGGGRLSVSTLYGFLGDVGCRTLVTDDRVDRTRARRALKACYPGGGGTGFYLEDLGLDARLSGFCVRAFGVRPVAGARATDTLPQALATLAAAFHNPDGLAA